MKVIFILLYSYYYGVNPYSKYHDETKNTVLCLGKHRQLNHIVENSKPLLVCFVNSTWYKNTLFMCYYITLCRYLQVCQIWFMVMHVYMFIIAFTVNLWDKISYKDNFICHTPLTFCVFVILWQFTNSKECEIRGLEIMFEMPCLLHQI